jgi:integrase
MATFRIIPLLGNENQQGLIPVVIRVTHKRLHRYIPTTYVVHRSQLDKSGRIRENDKLLKPQLNSLWNELQNILNTLSFRVNAYSPDELKEYIKKKLLGDSESIDFFAFAQEYVGSIKKNQPATAVNHMIALANLRRYVGDSQLNIRDITEKFLHAYIAWMGREGGVVKAKGGRKARYKPLGARGQSLYLGSIRKLFNEAQKRYNDYDKDDIPIPNRPFDRIKLQKAKAQKTSDVKALTVEQLQAIRDYQPNHTGDELARDCFMLSFYLCGINSVDLYSCTKISNEIITYNRSKTFDRRMDSAEVRVRIEPEAEPLYFKYRGGKGVFKFSERYATRSNFNAALNKGLKKIGAAVGISDLTFYYARHSWATLASNECRIPVETVGMALGHSDAKLITNVYIKKDWSKVFEANRKVLDLLSS